MAEKKQSAPCSGRYQFQRSCTCQAMYLSGALQRAWDTDHHAFQYPRKAARTGKGSTLTKTLYLDSSNSTPGIISTHTSELGVLLPSLLFAFLFKMLRRRIPSSYAKMK